MVFPLPILHVLLSKIKSSSKVTDFEKTLGVLQLNTGLFLFRTKSITNVYLETRKQLLLYKSISPYPIVNIIFTLPNTELAKSQIVKCIGRKLKHLWCILEGSNNVILSSQVWFHMKGFSWTMNTLFSTAQQCNRTRPEQCKIISYVFVSDGSLSTFPEKTGQGTRWSIGLTEDGNSSVLILLKVLQKRFRIYSPILGQDWIRKSTWNVYCILFVYLFVNLTLFYD